MGMCSTVPARPSAGFPASILGGTIHRPVPSNKVMRVSASLLAMAVLGLAGCQGGEEATTSVERDTTTVVTTGPPEQSGLTPEQKVQRWIRSCEVREILFTHEDVAHIRFRNGHRARVRLGDEATADKVFATAVQQRCPDFEEIIVAIE
jgi:hypothetical protein